MWIACSGPGARAVIDAAESRAYLLFAIAGAIAAATVAFAIVKRKRSAWLWVTIVVALLHPAWWMGARHGDCGHLVVEASYVWIGLVALFSALTVLLKKRELVV